MLILDEIGKKCREFQKEHNRAPLRVYLTQDAGFKAIEDCIRHCSNPKKIEELTSIVLRRNPVKLREHFKNATIYGIKTVIIDEIKIA